MVSVAPDEAGVAGGVTDGGAWVETTREDGTVDPGVVANAEEWVLGPVSVVLTCPVYPQLAK
ncbi:MAG: hypothetical protein OWR62_15855, partial [Sulfobacillus thermotolerans]|nr:hypothetical protein [Sulfobacillus thermotolerans]